MLFRIIIPVRTLIQQKCGLDARIKVGSGSAASQDMRGSYSQCYNSKE